MPDILIRGMEMPRNCMACSEPYEPFSMHRKCYADGHVFYYSYVHGRDKDCPLHELPPHGDLIDRGAIKTIIENHFKNHKIDRYDRELLLHYLDDEMAPVIVQAEREATQ